MRNLLLITDVTRLQKIFARVTDDKNIRLRVVNNLEMGGEEIAIENPDVVFVQTHLSGLSADILLMHLKKQLAGKSSRFVLLAAPGQTNPAILGQFQGWLDSSLEDNRLLSELQHLIVAPSSEPEINDAVALTAQLEDEEFTPQAVSAAESSALPGHSPDSGINEILSGTQLPAVPPPTGEPSLEEQGITYPHRKQLNVYSEFNSSFDSAVGSTPAPETLEQAATPPTHDWGAENTDIVEARPSRSKKGIFLLWLVPVVIAVVALTYFQQRTSVHKIETVALKTVPTPGVKPVEPLTLPSPHPAADLAKEALVKAAAKPETTPSKDQDKTSDKAVLRAISEKQEKKAAALPKPSGVPLTALPKFVPVDGLVKKYGSDNPGWELYMGNVTEFRVLRKDKSIKAIQVIDRGWRGVSEKFMKRAFLQVTNNDPKFSPLTSEKKEGYEIQRGSIADNIKVVYYRDEQGGRLRAFVLTWQ